MNYHSYESKIVYIVITALVCIQIGVFFALRHNNRSVVESTIKQELITGTEVFNQLIELRSRQLQQSAQILCSDFGFRESISTRDKPTIESMLVNHSQRANASISILSDLNRQVIATSPSTIKLDSAFVKEIVPIDASKQFNLNFVPMNLSAEIGTLDSSKQVKSGEIYQLINSPILSPLHSATLTLGFPIDSAYVHELKNLVTMDFLFFSQENGVWRLHASTINRLDAHLFTPHHDEIRHINTASEQYLSMPIMLQSSSNKTVIAVVAKPMSKLMQPFVKFEKILIYLLLATVVLSAITIYMVTHKMVRPLNDLAHLDNLTGLGNRRLFSLTLSNAVKALATKPFTLMMMDLNSFKVINDTKGHDVGDRVLQICARRLKEVLRDSDTVVRLGGDEFAMILQEVNPHSLAIIAEKINAAINQPIKIDDDFISVGISIGIAQAPLDADTQFEIIKKADKAMYGAKLKQKNFQFYADI